MMKGKALKIRKKKDSLNNLYLSSFVREKSAVSVNYFNSPPFFYHNIFRTQILRKYFV